LLSGKFENSIIYKRSSVRSYTEEPLASDQVEHILHAGMAAPSANNVQPWFFVTIDEKDILKAIAKGLPYGKMTASAQLAILVCAKRDVADEDPFYEQALGAAVENMLLAAAEGGVGSCWCGIHSNSSETDDREIMFRDLLNMPDGLIPFALIVLGVPANKNARKRDRFDEARIHRNAWPRQ
jgi:nitroreductase